MSDPMPEWFAVLGTVADDEGSPLVVRQAVADALSYVQALRTRVAQLEAEREVTGTEWGVRWPSGTVHTPARNSEQMTRRLAEHTSRTLMVRDVFAPGPWRVATE